MLERFARPGSLRPPTRAKLASEITAGYVLAHLSPHAGQPDAHPSPLAPDEGLRLAVPSWMSRGGGIGFPRPTADAMNQLPPPQQMAELVSGVTKTVLGLTFLPDTNSSPWSSLVWRTAILPIPGDRPLTIGLSSDERGCSILSAAMFSCAPDQVDTTMMNDALCELVNMTAGLMKSHMALNQQLGLPKIVHGSDAPYMAPARGRYSAVLRAENIGLVLWVLEGSPPANAGG